MAEAKQYLVIAGFLGTAILNEETGEKVQYTRGDAIDLTDDEAAVELHRNRIVAFDPATADAIRAESVT